MSVKGLEVIERSAQQAHEWVNELTERLDWVHHHNGLRLLRTILHQIRDHLGHDESAQFSAQLPLLIRGMYFEGWVPRRTPVKQRRVADFIAQIEDQVGRMEEYRGPRDITTALEFLNSRISRGEIEDIRRTLPEEIRGLWPAP